MFNQHAHNHPPPHIHQHTHLTEPLGVDTLRSWLVAAAAREHAASAAAAAAAAALQPFLFAVDHCFAIKGQGTVLTGTVLQGTCAVGDVIELPTLKLKRQVSMSVVALSGRTVARPPPPMHSPNTHDTHVRVGRSRILHDTTC